MFTTCIMSFHIIRCCDSSALSLSLSPLSLSLSLSLSISLSLSLSLSSLSLSLSLSLSSRRPIALLSLSPSHPTSLSSNWGARSPLCPYNTLSLSHTHTQTHTHTHLREELRCWAERCGAWDRLRSHSTWASSSALADNGSARDYIQPRCPTLFWHFWACRD